MLEHAARLLDRFRGALLGTAVGDALGAPFEGRQMVDPSELERWSGADEPLRWTDDTHMAIGVAESLVQVGGFDAAQMARRFVANYDAEPWRGYGAGPPRVFAALRDGARWDEPARELFGGTGSYGNGAAMRVAPVGLLWCDNPSRAVAVARDSAAITHAHEQGRQGAALQAHAIALLVGQDRAPGWTLPADSAVSLRGTAPDPAFVHALDHALAAPGDRTARDVIAVLGNGLAAVEAVPAALHAFLRYPHAFGSAVAYAVSLGGDTDTIAAMTGALAGAFLGAGAIPEPWRNRLERGDEIEALADTLLNTHLRRAAEPDEPPRS